MTDEEYADEVVAKWGNPPPNKGELRSIIIAALIHARKPFPFAAREAPTKPENRIPFVPAGKDRLR